MSESYLSSKDVQVKVNQDQEAPASIFDSAKVLADANSAKVLADANSVITQEIQSPMAQKSSHKIVDS